jgi:hypothetical protein
MPTLTLETTLIYGDTTPNGAVPQRTPLTFTISYTEDSKQRVRVAAGVTDAPITVDSVGAPKFLLIRSLEGDVGIKVSDGVVLTPTPSSLAANSGYMIVANPNGQVINRVLVTTPASPASGALVEVLAFE